MSPVSSLPGLPELPDDKLERARLMIPDEVMKKIRDKDVVHTLFAEIAPHFADREGGYTRIIKVGSRHIDSHIG